MQSESLLSLETPQVCLLHSSGTLGRIQRSNHKHNPDSHTVLIPVRPKARLTRMPYTPPSKPPSEPPSKPIPPATAAGFGGSRKMSARNVRPALPRSASYLTRYRKQSSVASVSSCEDGVENQLTPPGTSEDLRGLIPSDSVRQSPPPLTDGRGMPPGTILSPPESLSGSDDETLRIRRQPVNFEELKVAVSQISARWENSPPKSGEPSRPAAAIGAERMHKSFGTGVPNVLASRKSSQASLSTVPKTILVQGSSIDSESSEGGSEENSEEDSEGDLRHKPSMIRKKSGELVRSALRPSQRRSTSVPGTPTFPKAVHFDSNLEHVRHFLQVDHPLAVSAGSSPNFEYAEYPFPHSEDGQPARLGPPEWELIASNFPTDSIPRNSLPVRVERIWLSNDSKSMLGSVAVANFAYHKLVACRFTFDEWNGVSEVAAEYTSEVCPRSSAQGYDRFTFTIKLSNLTHLETKTLLFCIRYNVHGQEYWDNNNNANFQVHFRKRNLTPNWKNNSQDTEAEPSGQLPRSTGWLFRNGYGSGTTLEERLKAKDYWKLAFEKVEGNGPMALSSYEATSQWPGIMASNGESPAMRGYSYEEILNRFCFVCRAAG